MKNKCIFITGGTSSIGKSLIYKYAEKKYNIFFTYYKNIHEAKKISIYLSLKKIKHNFVRMDFNNTNSIDKAFNTFTKKFKKLNIFINNASINIQRTNFLKLKNKNIEKNIRTLVVGNIYTIKKALITILKYKNIKNRNLINISSFSSISGGRNIHLYAASKSALNTLITALAKDYFKNNIKIFSIVPKHIDTKSFRKNNNIKSKKNLFSFLKRKKIRKINSSENFASFVYNKANQKFNSFNKSVVFYD